MRFNILEKTFRPIIFLIGLRVKVLMLRLKTQLQFTVIYRSFILFCFLSMVDRSRGASTSKKDEKRKDKPDAVDASKKPGTSSLGYFFKRQPRFHTRYFTRGS